MTRTKKVSSQPAILLPSRSSQAEVLHAVLVQGRHQLLIPDAGLTTSIVGPTGSPTMALHFQAAHGGDHHAGFQGGHRADHQAGHHPGYEAGHEAGYLASSEAGYEAGYEAAYEAAYEAGYAAGNQAGHTAGHAAGYQSGFLEGQQGAEQAWQTRVKQAEQLLQQLPAVIAQRLELLEDDMLDLVFTSLCRLLGQISLSAQAVRAQVQQALIELGARSVAVMRLHPQDIACLQDDPYTAAMLQQMGVDSKIPFLADAHITLGGCIIDTPAGSLDARFEIQFQALRDSLLSVRTVRALQSAQTAQTANPDTGAPC